MIEVVTGLALLTTYVSSLVEYRRRERRREAEAAE
jgi:predicted benzoate:H+ symporter BenE